MLIALEESGVISNIKVTGFWVVRMHVFITLLLAIYSVAKKVSVCKGMAEEPRYLLLIDRDTEKGQQTAFDYCLRSGKETALMYEVNVCL